MGARSTKNICAILLSILLVSSTASAGILLANNGADYSGLQATNENSSLKDEIGEHVNPSESAYVSSPIQHKDNRYFVAVISNGDQDPGGSDDVFTQTFPYKDTLAYESEFGKSSIRRVLVFKSNGSGISLVPRSNKRVIQSVITSLAAQTWYLKTWKANPHSYSIRYLNYNLNSPQSKAQYLWEGLIGALKSDTDRYLAALQSITTVDRKNMFINESIRKEIRSASSAAESATIATKYAKEIEDKDFVEVAGEKIDSRLAQRALHQYADDIKYISNRISKTTQYAGFASSLSSLVLAISEQRIYSSSKIRKLSRIQKYSHQQTDAALAPALNNAITKLENQHKNLAGKTRDAIITWIKENGIDITSYTASTLGTKFASWLTAHSAYAASLQTWASSSSASTLLAGAARVGGYVLLTWQVGGILQGKKSTYLHLKKAQYSYRVMSEFKDIQKHIQRTYGRRFNKSGSEIKSDIARAFHATIYFEFRSLAEFYRQEYASMEAFRLMEADENPGLEGVLEELFKKDMTDEYLKTKSWASSAMKLARRVQSPATESVLAKYPQSADKNVGLRSITYNQTKFGSIDKGDPSGKRGYYEPVQFAGQEGDVVTITMESRNDTYLMLQAPNGTIVKEVDDGNGPSSIDNYRLRQSGNYTIIATSYDSSAFFTYNLSLQHIASMNNSDLRSVSYNQTHLGAVDTIDDPTGYRGSYEPINFSGQEGDLVTIRMRPIPEELHSSTDTYLLLQAPNGSIVAKVDDGTGPSSIEKYRLKQSGNYTIIATSYDSSAFFTYNLTLERVATMNDSDLRSISYGQRLRGAVDKIDDPTGYRGYYEPINFSGNEGDVITITLQPIIEELHSLPNCGTYLMLQAPNGSIVREVDDGSGASSIDKYRLKQSGEYTIMATSYDSSAFFAYNLTLERVAEMADSDLRSISYNQTRNGAVDTIDDPTGYRGYYEPVNFSGQVGEVITISMQPITSELHSSTDTYLLLQAPNGSIVAKVDDGSGPSSIDKYRLRQSGNYTIIATSYDAGAFFAYNLSLQRVATMDDSDLRLISYNQTHTGAIDTIDDPTGYRGYYEPVNFSGQEGDVVTIRMAPIPEELHSSMDSYLILQAPNGSIVAEVDDGSGPSTIDNYRLKQSGNYTIIATSYDAGAFFAYNLSLHRVATMDNSDLRSISYNQTHTGAIDTIDDPTGYRGYYEPINFSGQAGDVVSITIRPVTSELHSSTDTYLLLQAPNGSIVAEVDDGSGPSSISNYRLKQSGEYTIIATSYDASAFFAYNLTLEHVDTMNDSDLRSISYGQTRSGAVDTIDDPTGYRGYYEPINFSGQEGDVITIKMEAITDELHSSTDTYLMLQAPDGTIVRKVDDGSGPSSITKYQLRQPGIYTIIATSYDSSAFFAYNLTLVANTTTETTTTTTNTANLCTVY